MKGIFSGTGAAFIAYFSGAVIPNISNALMIMLLGFASYGLSIFFYVRAQNIIGASRTSAYYAASPFIGVLLSFVLLNEKLSGAYLFALAVMFAGTVLVVMDTLILTHTHEHVHIYGSNHMIIHSHTHSHYAGTEKHIHFHA